MTEQYDPISDPMNDPNAPWHARDVPAEGYERVWFNDQDFIDWDTDYVDSIYVDNNIVALSIQPDAWTLEIDNEQLNLWYSAGNEFQLPLGTILDSWDGPSKLVQMSNGLIASADHNLQPMFNAFTTPRLRWIRWDLHRRIQELAEQRLELAELVAAFATIIGAYGGLDGTSTKAFKGAMGT